MRLADAVVVCEEMRDEVEEAAVVKVNRQNTKHLKKDEKEDTEQ